MSAAELLKQVEALSPRERRKFVLAVLTLKEEAMGETKAKERQVKWPDIEARAERIFGKRIMPNLVLLEREESAF